MTFDDQKFSVLDSKLHIFRRPNSSYWWCGFHHRSKYIRTSTKQKERQRAIDFAKSWYHRKQFEIETGQFVVKKERKFKQVAKDAIRSYQNGVKRGERSASYVNGVEEILKSRVLPYFGDIYISDVDNVQWQKFKEHIRQDYNPNLSRRTFHQFKNAIRIVLNEAYNNADIKTLPVFKDRYVRSKTGMQRTWFSESEYRLLHTKLRANIKRLAKTRWKESAKELYDFVIFMTNTGLRVNEARNVRYCDVEVLKDKNYLDKDENPRRYLLIKNIKGKRGSGECRSHWGAVNAYERICKRNPDLLNSESQLFKEHHRDMFNKILVENDLKFTNGREKRKRDFVSLRHTYICFRLMRGASVYDVAANCRTSVHMIEQHYARHLKARMLTSIASETFEQ